MTEFTKIAIWQTAYLGDAVLTLSLVQAVKKKWPEARIDYWVRKGFEPLFKAQSEIHAVRGFDKRGRSKGLSGALGMGKTLDRNGYGLLISAHTSIRTAIAAKASGIKRRIGYDRPWYNRFVYTDVVPRRFNELYELERLMELARPLGITGFDTPRMDLDPAAKAKADEFYARFAGQKTVGIHPGSTWPTKRWPARYFSSLADMLLAKGHPVIVFGGPEEKDMSREVIDSVTADKSGLTDLSGKLSLPELAAYLNGLSVYVCNDSGPMHLAWTQDTPVVAMFGPTTRDLGFFPRGENSKVMEAARLDCRPCGLHGPKKCPKGHHKCMLEIPPQSVFEAVCEKL